MGKKLIYILAVFAAIVVASIFIFKADPVPDKNQKSFETDSEKDTVESNLVDGLIDDITNDPEFDDFNFDEEEDESIEDSTEVVPT